MRSQSLYRAAQSVPVSTDKHMYVAWPVLHKIASDIVTPFTPQIQRQHTV